jgi:HPt (histidine-containing phosphotransfer) domain-containing protein
MHEELSKGGATPATWVVRPDPDLADLIPAFMQNRRTELAELESAIARGDFEFIRRTAHTWKGICRPYGFMHLETLSRSLEEAGLVDDKDEVQAVIGEIRTYLQNVRIVYDS